MVELADAKLSADNLKFANPTKAICDCYAYEACILVTVPSNHVARRP